MTTQTKVITEVLSKIPNVDEAKARKATEAITALTTKDGEQLATKDFVRAEVAELKESLERTTNQKINWAVVVILGYTTIMMGIATTIILNIPK